MRVQCKFWTRHSHTPFCWSVPLGRRSVQHLRQHTNSPGVCLGSVVGGNTRTESLHDNATVTDQPNMPEEPYIEEKISGDDVRDLQALLDGFKSQLSRLDKEVSEKADLEKLQAKFATQQAALEKMHKAIMENEKTYQDALEKDRIRLAELERVLSETEAYLTKDLEPERKNLEEKCRQLEKETEELKTKIKFMAESSKTPETTSTKSPETTNDVKVPQGADTTELEKK